MVSIEVAMTGNNILIPMIRTALPSLIAQQIVGVQPMTTSATGVFSMDLRIPHHSHPRYKFSRQWHIGRVSYDQNGDEVFKWCEGTFGSSPKNPDAWCRWYRYSGKQFYFRDEQDFVLFMLRWS